MGVATGCGCKEVYRFPHTTYPYSSCICSFLQQQHPYFLFILKMFFYIYIVALTVIMGQHNIEGAIARSPWTWYV